jgi:very-short-patch-repair endonuclease
MSDIEETLAWHILIARLPAPEREVRFHPTRKWRFDFAWREQRLAVEVEGGTWAGGRHTRGEGFAEDCTKYNAATLAGWRVLRFTSEMVESGEAVQAIEQALGGTP